MEIAPALEESWSREIQTQRNLFISAVEGVNASLQDVGGGTSRVFANIQSMLNHAGLISKILWGERRHPDPNGEHCAIRESINMDDRIWLLQSRTLRNALEHYHERLKGWGDRAVIIDMNIGTKDMIKVEGMDGMALFDRHLDPVSMTFSIRDESIPLQDLTNEVQEVATLASIRLTQLEVTGFCV